MLACMDENGLTMDEESVTELTKALYQDAIAPGQQGITFAALKSQISKHEGLIENLTIRSLLENNFHYGSTGDAPKSQNLEQQ